MPNGWHRKATTSASIERARQYNSTLHKRLRRQHQAVVDRGEAACWRCGVWIPPGTPWHLGHDDHDRSIYRGVECPPCNLKAAARKGAQVANQRRHHHPTTPVRHWRSHRWD